MSFGARHRAATKPMPLTRRNSRVKMMISVTCSLMLMRSLPLRHAVDDGGGHAREHEERELPPVEGREAEQPRWHVVVERGQQRHHDRHEQQPVPGAAIAS